MKKRFAFTEETLPIYMASAILLLTSLGCLFYISLINIGPGCAGVLYRPFGTGTVTQEFLAEGTHWVAPWNKVYIYSIRTQQHSEDHKDVLTQNGLSVTAHLTCRYSISATHIGQLHKEIGQHYLESIIIPSISSAVREVIGKYTPDHLYSTDRNSMQEEINKKVIMILEKEGYAHYFLGLTILMRGIDLPPRIDNAIQAKLEQEQLLETYKFKNEIAMKEKKRKIIEAQGIAEANKIIAKTLSPELLKMKEIEAKERLAESENAKIVDINNTDIMLNA